MTVMQIFWEKWRNFQQSSIKYLNNSIKNPSSKNPQKKVEKKKQSEATLKFLLNCQGRRRLDFYSHMITSSNRRRDEVII